MNPYPKLVEAREVPLWRRVLARIGFPTIIYWDEENFNAPTPIYVAWCKYHNVFYLDYPHGFNEYLQCPLCFKLWKKMIEAEREELACQTCQL